MLVQLARLRATRLAREQRIEPYPTVQLVRTVAWTAIEIGGTQQRATWLATSVIDYVHAHGFHIDDLCSQNGRDAISAMLAATTYDKDVPCRELMRSWYGERWWTGLYRAIVAEIEACMMYPEGFDVRRNARTTTALDEADGVDGGSAVDGVMDQPRGRSPVGLCTSECADVDRNTDATPSKSNLRRPR